MTTDDRIPTPPTNRPAAQLNTPAAQTTAQTAPAPTSATQPAPSATPKRRPAPIPPQRFERVPWRSIAIFGVIAYAIMALCAAPFWFTEQRVTHPMYAWVIGGAMFAPAIATLVVAKLVDKESWRTAVGLRFRGRWRQIVLWSVLGLVLMFAINLAAAVIMVLRGVPGDLTGRAWASIVGQQMAEAGAPMPIAAAVALVVVITAINLLVTCVPALGEEIGWRGWLWPRLAPLGRPLAVVLGGAIWSLWHLPVVLIGHNYTGENRLAAVAMFLPACMAMNLFFGALTERAIGNPIPAGIAHATMNSTLGFTLSLVATTETPQAMNWFLDTPLGLTGIILLVLVGLAVLPRKRPQLSGTLGAES